MTIKGIDVSSYQSTTYPLTGVDFVVVKATEGTSYINPKHAAQVERARSNGRIVGHYHFVRDGSVSAQVDYFLKHAGAREGEFLALDWEDAKVSGAEKDAFLKALKAKSGGRKVVLYCNYDFWKHHDSTSYAADGLWIADYVTAGKPRIDAKWLIHQYTSTPTDTNVARFASRGDMAKWAGTKSSSVKPNVPAFPGAAYFRAGAKNKYVTLLGQALVRKGYGHFYTQGPGPQWTAVDRAAVQAFQKAQKWSGSDADGYPGPETWRRLFS
ncbi:GH25 family lysozyme [Streptomyces sp. NPDC050095]|uniref:GH25 family lysozyme n=1 Tax=unclassified Streptomyces TaxID=2593676 RepID=UPI003427A022